MADTFVKIASVTVGAGGASSIDFTSIPATYTDLLVKLSGRTIKSGTEDQLNIRFNSDTGANYSRRTLYGDYTAAGSLSATGATALNPGVGIINGNTSTTNAFSTFEIYIPNYTASTNKSVSIDAASETNSSSANAGYDILCAGLWANSAAITSISLFAGNNFMQYSTATLYGISKS